VLNRLWASHDRRLTDLWIEETSPSQKFAAPPSRPFFITNKCDRQHRHAISHARQW
jgi:hypothetical protein